FAHAKREPVGFGQAANLRIAISGPKDRRQLAVAVGSRVIHFDNNHALEPIEYLVHSIWQRVQMAQMKRGDAFTSFPGPVNSLMNRTEGRTPTHEQSFT